MTGRLYHADAMLRRFDAELRAVTTFDGEPAIVLDATAFYPEAGGQLGDRGALGALEVRDTQELDDGTIVHLVADSPALSSLVPGDRITGELDWIRRRQHMAQHTAQHLLSGALESCAAAPTASARLGETTLTIDVARDRIPESELAAAEALANDLIDDDLAIRAWFPDPAELASLRLRRDPKVAAGVRVVAIGDFDFSPCGGTHCARTSQLGAIRITGTERYKGMTRLTFTAARRGRSELFERDRLLRSLATQFSCSPAEVPAAIDKLRRDAAAAGDELTATRSRLASMIVAQLIGPSGSDAAVVATVPGDPELLKSVAAKLVAAGRDALLCTTEDASTTVVLARAAGSSLDCGSLMKRLAAHGGGRGGGRAERAEGRIPFHVADWTALIATLTD